MAKRKSKGTYYKLFGHRLAITKLKENKWDENNPILTATCRPHCCTRPYGLTITSTKEDFETILKGDKQ